MARGRFIKPDFFDDPVLARCSHPARLLFVACWQLSDRCGVFEWDVSKLRKYVFGYEDVRQNDVEVMLNELLNGGFLRFGEHDGRKYGFVVNLAKHQKFHVKELARHESIAKSDIWSSTGPAPVQHRSEHLPIGLSLETNTNTKILDLAAKVQKQKPLPSASRSGVTVPIRIAWLAEYERKYKQPGAWGRRENGQAAQLLGTFSSDELLELIPYFFAWKRPEVIRSGHSFGKGANCFVLKVDELRADIADGERRTLAAQVQEAEKTSNIRAIEGSFHEADLAF